MLSILIPTNICIFDLFKFLTKFEIARTSEISYYCLKGMKIKHVVGYSLELLEQGIIWSIIENLVLICCISLGY